MFADDGYVSLHLLGFLLLVAFLIHVALLGWMFVKVVSYSWLATCLYPLSDKVYSLVPAVAVGLIVGGSASAECYCSLF